MSSFLTIAEAAKRAGKSTSTIRRFVKSVTTDDNHPDRPQIHPLPDEVREYYSDGVQYVWKISEELVSRQFPALSETHQPTGSVDGLTHAKLIDVLQRSIGKLQEQLDRKDHQIDQLNARLHESNVIQREIQQRLALSAPDRSLAQDAVAVAVAVEPANNVRPERRRWRRLFRRS